MPTVTSFYTVKKTFSSTTYGQALSLVSVPFYSANFYVNADAVYFGDGTSQDFYVPVNGYFDFRNGDLKDIFFKAHTNPVTIVCVATVNVKYVQDVLGVLAL